MTYRPKYANPPRRKKETPPHRGCPVVPERWISGPDPIDHDKYYAWLKHKSQAAYRNEAHYLTWDEWQKLWPLDAWLQRGRRPEDLMLIRIDNTDDWCWDNVEVVPVKFKGKYLRRSA